MEGESHTVLVFVKHQEMALYHKAWPNHVIVGLPASADSQGLGAARFYIKVMDSSRQMEFSAFPVIQCRGVQACVFSKHSKTF